MVMSGQDSSFEELTHAKKHCGRRMKLGVWGKSSKCLTAQTFIHVGNMDITFKIIFFLVQFAMCLPGMNVSAEDIFRV